MEPGSDAIAQAPLRAAAAWYEIPADQVDEGKAILRSELPLLNEARREVVARKN